MILRKRRPQAVLALDPEPGTELTPYLGQLPAVASQDQFGMELKKSRLEWYYNLKNRINRLGSVTQVFPYWRSINTSLAICTSVTLVGVILFSLTNQASGLHDLPFIYKQSTRSWEFVEKEFLIAVPIFLAAALLILINLSSSIYRFDRRLSFMLNTGIIVFNVLGIFGFYQIISLLLVY